MSDIKLNHYSLNMSYHSCFMYFRDYKNNSNDEDSDSDYDPHEYLSARAVKKAKVSKSETSASTEKITKMDGTRRSENSSLTLSKKI